MVSMSHEQNLEKPAVRSTADVSSRQMMTVVMTAMTGLMPRIMNFKFQFSTDLKETL